MIGLSGCAWDKVQPDVCFETEVLPVMTTYCSTTGCHNATDREAGYDFTTYNGIMRGVQAGQPGRSSIIASMKGISEESMPPRNHPQPSADQIATISAWVKSGAANTTNCGGSTCDTTAAVTYSADVQPMLTTYCIGCHSGSFPSGGLDLSDFATVQTNALNGRIPGSISGNPSYISMPPGSSLVSACDISKVERWVAAGALPN